MLKYYCGKREEREKNNKHLKVIAAFKNLVYLLWIWSAEISCSYGSLISSVLLSFPHPHSYVGFHFSTYCTSTISIDLLLVLLYIFLIMIVKL